MKPVWDNPETPISKQPVKVKLRIYDELLLVTYSNINSNVITRISYINEREDMLESYTFKGVKITSYNNGVQEFDNPYLLSDLDFQKIKELKKMLSTLKAKEWHGTTQCEDTFY